MIENNIIVGKRVLAIDDSTTISLLLQHLLQESGALEVAIAHSGKEGLLIAQDHHFDLIILDLYMPDMSGIEVLEIIRQFDQETTIVIVTGANDVKQAALAVRSGADHYIQKDDIAMDKIDYTDFFYALEQAFEHRTGIIAQANLVQMKENFHAMVTHDLRNPTNTILLALQLLHKKGLDDLSPAHQHVFSIIDESAHKLLSLINNYLEFSKMDAGYLELQYADADLRDLVEHAVRQITLQMQQKNQILQITLPEEAVMIEIDEKRLQQVFDNLIGNAVKYTPNGGQISVRLLPNGAKVRFEVEDNGLGIPEAQVSKLFEKYQRVKGTAAEKEQGTGLGLMIVREIVEAHGGIVEVESEGHGTGSLFAVTLPL